MIPSRCRRKSFLFLVAFCCGLAASEGFLSSATLASVPAKGEHASVATSGNSRSPPVNLFQASSSSSSANNESYHLIWSPGAWKKFLLGVWTVFVAHRFSPLPSLLSSFGQNTLVSSSVSNIVLPLLASSCCLIQLGINLLAGGCAGFNTVLGPTRPYFLSLLFYGTVQTARWTSFSWYGATAFRWAVALLPEALDFWNRSQQQATSVIVGSNEKPHLTPDTAPWSATLQLEIPTMGCVACINKIDTALRNAGQSRVVQASSSLNPLGAKGGYAKVKILAETRQEIDSLTQSLIRSVEEAGFEPCRVGHSNVQQR